MVDTADGPYWMCGDDRWDAWGGRKGVAGAMGGRRLALERGGVLEPGVLRPTTTALRLADMDRDGIDATVMYGPDRAAADRRTPSCASVCYRALQRVAGRVLRHRARRGWSARASSRSTTPKSAADEVRHLKQLGLRTGMLLAARVETPLWDEAWEPLWEAAAETGIPIGFHLGGGLRTVVPQRARSSTTRATWACAWRAPRSRWTSRWPR